MDPKIDSRVQYPTPPAISGKKRQRSSSSPPETNLKRQTLSADRSPTPKSLTDKPPTPKPVRSEGSWCCPNCGHRCWLCNLSSAAPPEHPEQIELGDEEERQRAKMAIDDASSDDASSTTDTSSSVPSSMKRKKYHYAQLGMTFVGPKDQDFGIRILNNLGVVWARSPERNNKPPQFLRSQPLPQSKVIIKGDDKELEGITMDFEEYEARPYDDYTLTTLCWDSIILRDRWVENALGDGEAFKFYDDYDLVVIDQEPIITSVRRDKWKPQKQGPPMPQDTMFVYDWDVKLDTSYAVSIRMFDLEYRKKLILHVFEPWVAEHNFSVCPYLTVEYKRGRNQMRATDQAVAAAVLWLYQRKNLRDTIGKDYDGISHFLITIVDSAYVISEGRIIGNEYIMCVRITGRFTRIEELRLYIEWSNAIHAWGLGVNAENFKKDIESLVELRSAQKPSNLPTPAGTDSPTGPSSQRPGQFEGEKTGEVEAVKVTI